MKLWKIDFLFNLTLSIITTILIIILYKTQNVSAILVITYFILFSAITILKEKVKEKYNHDNK